MVAFFRPHSRKSTLEYQWKSRLLTSPIARLEFNILMMAATRLTRIFSTTCSSVQPPQSISRCQPLKAPWRAFTSSSRLNVDLTENVLASLKVKQDRLMGDIHHTCQWGVGERWGKYVYWSHCIIKEGMLAPSYATPKALGCHFKHRAWLNSGSHVRCLENILSGYFSFWRCPVVRILDLHRTGVLSRLWLQRVHIHCWCPQDVMWKTLVVQAGAFFVHSMRIIRNAGSASSLSISTSEGQSSDFCPLLHLPSHCAFSTQGPVVACWEKRQIPAWTLTLAFQRWHRHWHVSSLSIRPWSLSTRLVCGNHEVFGMQSHDW